MTETGELRNKGFLVILVGVEDVVGKRGMDTLLRQAKLAQYIGRYPPSTMDYDGHKTVYMTLINHALFDIYGTRGARAILTQVGRGRWKSALEENGPLASATKLALRFMPRRRQIKFAMDVAAKAYSEQLNTTIKVVAEGDDFFWEDHNCGNCIDWKSESPVCYTTAGFVYGLVKWATGSEDFKVDEVACRAKGDPICRHRVTLLA